MGITIYDGTAPGAYERNMGPGVIGQSARGTIARADAYLASRADDANAYDRRCVRYDAALKAMDHLDLCDTDTVVDVGAGWTEFGARLHTGRVSPYGTPGFPASRARYIPVDACIDGADLNTWLPPRRAEWFVALEVLEHLKRPDRLAHALMASADKGVVISTPNPATTDVLGMDATHITPVSGVDLEAWGFQTIMPSSFYGKPNDSLFAVWSKGTA